MTGPGFALEHLKTASRENNIKEIKLLSQQESFVAEITQPLDNLLASEKFRSLQKLELSKHQHIDLFHKLKMQGKFQ